MLSGLKTSERSGFGPSLKLKGIINCCVEKALHRRQATLIAMSKLTFRHNHGIELCLSWRPDYGGHYPKDEALSAGSNLFVIRAKDECAGNNWVPGKLQVDANLDRPYAYISYNNYAIPVENYEVLTCSAMPGFGCGHSWVPVDDDNWSLPTALIAGADEKGLLFVARGKIQGEMCVGKYSPGREAALVPWHGEERQLEEFEVLVFNSRSY